jgi:hypothetical protein
MVQISLVGPEIPTIFGTRKDHYHVHKGALHVRILSLINPVGATILFIEDPF